MLRGTLLVSGAAVRAVGPAISLRSHNRVLVSAFSTISEGVGPSTGRRQTSAAKHEIGTKANEEALRPGERSQVFSSRFFICRLYLIKNSSFSDGRVDQRYHRTDVVS